MSMACVDVDGMALDRSAWLAMRRHSIGASDAAAILDCSPYRTPLQVYMDKLGLLDDEAETPAQRRGRRLEALAIEDYEDHIGQAVRHRQVFVRHPALSYMTATLDAVRPDGRPVEVKTVGPYALKEWGDEGTDAIPTHILIQVHHQLIVANEPVADVAVLFGGERFKVYTVEANPGVAAEIVEREGDFWRQVQARTPPHPGAGDLAALHRLFPEAEGEVDLDEIGVMAVDRWEQACDSLREVERLRDQYKAVVMEAIGNAGAARLPDGRRLKRTIVNVAEATITRKASSHTRLSILKAKDIR